MLFAYLLKVDKFAQRPTKYDRHLPFPSHQFAAAEFSTTTNYIGDNATLWSNRTNFWHSLVLCVLVFFFGAARPLARAGAVASLLKPYESSLELIVPFIFPVLPVAGERGCGCARAFRWEVLCNCIFHSCHWRRTDTPRCRRRRKTGKKGGKH